MDIQTTVRMVYLAEAAADKQGHTPYFIKRCVFAVAKKFGGDRKALDQAFGPCVKQAQKSGKLKKGSMEPTKKGIAWSGTKKREKSPFGFSMSAYEKMLARARQKKEARNVSLALIYSQLQEELQIEQHVDEAGVKTAVGKTAAELKKLKTASNESLVAIPGVLANLLSMTLGGAGVVGRAGARGLLSAVDINPASFAQDLKVMVGTFRNLVTSKIDWGRVKQKTEAAANQLALIPRGEITPERVLSILGDFFLKMEGVMKAVVRGISDKRAKNAALVLQYDMQEIREGLNLLAGTAEE
jgi:hypothetical protein